MPFAKNLLVTSRIVKFYLRQSYYDFNTHNFELFTGLKSLGVKGNCQVMVKPGLVLDEFHIIIMKYQVDLGKYQVPAAKKTFIDMYTNWTKPSWPELCLFVRRLNFESLEWEVLIDDSSLEMPDQPVKLENFAQSQLVIEDGYWAMTSCNKNFRNDLVVQYESQSKSD